MQGPIRCDSGADSHSLDGRRKVLLVPLFADPTAGIADSALARAAELAEEGRGSVSPNPLVGCLIVRDGRTVGEGYHAHAGGPHAEAVALEAAGSAARGSDVYVTLEPCNHHGRTPPCVGRLIEHGVASVTIGMRDPNPTVAGGGASVLEAHGIRVTWAPDPSPFERLNEAWLKKLATGLPFVTVKVGMSLDARVALRADERARMTGSGGREVTMRLRDRASAVAVGGSTLRIDDPSLTVRADDGSRASRQPTRLVFCRTTVPGVDHTLFTDGAGPVVVFVGEKASPGRCEDLIRRGVCVVRYDPEEGIPGLLRAVVTAGFDDVLIEAGPTIFEALWRDGHIDELVVVTAGGMAGSLAPGIGVSVEMSTGDSLDVQMRAVDAFVAEDDAVTVWRPL